MEQLALEVAGRPDVILDVFCNCDAGTDDVYR